VLGGHPVLANAAKDAIKKWKYEPASQETNVTVEFDFGSLGG
jgi:outer membrane biosynthesis protein TonB